MKTKIKLSLLYLMAISSVFFYSCEDGDTEKPVINLIEPEDGDVLKIGSDIHFEMELSDNVMLKSYKVEIHSNFDGHGHRSTASTINFTFSKSWDVHQRNAFIHHHEIEIPESATPGDYHLMVYCADEAGNESYVARNIVLSHTGKEHQHHDHED